jgi:lipoate-protein ligase A
MMMDEDRLTIGEWTIDDRQSATGGIRRGHPDGAPDDRIASRHGSCVTHPSSVQDWILLSDDVPRPGWWHMALDLALLEETARVGVGFVRLYRWAPSALSFGRHEPALRRYDRARIEQRGLDAVRRPTGGRAVWHARELTYSVTAPCAAFGGLAESYRTIHATLAGAIRTLGVAAPRAPPARPLTVGSGACFASAAGGEVLAMGRKLVGSAQLRQGNTFLQQGSLLLEDDQQLVAQLTRGQAPCGGEITLREAADRTIAFAEAAAAIAAAMSRWDGQWDGPGPDLDLELLAARHAARFRDPAWTWRR